MADNAKNRFGSEGKDWHGTLPDGKLLNFDRLLEVLDDGTDLGEHQHHDNGPFLPFEDFYDLMYDPNNDDTHEFAEDQDDEDLDDDEPDEDLPSEAEALPLAKIYWWANPTQWNCLPGIRKKKK